jgi:hypothetical protein
MTIRQLVQKARLLANSCTLASVHTADVATPVVINDLAYSIAGEIAELADNIEAIFNNPADMELHELWGDD